MPPTRIRTNGVVIAARWGMLPRIVAVHRRRDGMDSARIIIKEKVKESSSSSLEKEEVMLAGIAKDGRLNGTVMPKDVSEVSRCSVEKGKVKERILEANRLISAVIADVGGTRLRIVGP